MSPVNRRWLGLLAWGLAVVLITFPWLTLQNHPHWMLVRYPFDGRDQPLEIALNFALYLPGGWLLAELTGGSRRKQLGLAVGLATTFSLATEAAQLFSHGRVPSLVDVLANHAGAWVGAMAARRSLY